MILKSGEEEVFEGEGVSKVDYLGEKECQHVIQKVEPRLLKYYQNVILQTFSFWATFPIIVTQPAEIPSLTLDQPLCGSCQWRPHPTRGHVDTSLPVKISSF